MLRIWPGHCHFSEDFSNFEQRIKNNQSQPSHGGAEKQRDFKCSWWEIKEIRQEQHSCTTRDQHFLDSYSFIRIWFFCVCNSCATVIPEWLSHHLDTRRFCVDTFLDLGKRLLQCSRVQSRFRGTRTLPYALVSCGTSWHPHPTICPCELRDCSLLSWHQHRERTYSGVVFWT